MYPNLYYIFKDFFGVEWNFLHFVNTFGFFVAISFFLAALTLTSELKRKGKLGQVQPKLVEITVGKPATTAELILNFLLGFILGYKILGLFVLDKSATEDPQAFIFSTIGSWPAGIVMGLLFAGMKWWEKNKQKLPAPEKRNVRIWPHDRVPEFTILALIFGIFGAKLFDIFENWSDFLKQPASYIFSPAGLTFYGGLICAAIAIWIYARKNQVGFWQLNDSAAPGLMLAYAVGRIGCQVAGDGDWGINNTKANPFSWLPDWMWSYKFPHNVNEAGVPIKDCVGKYCNELPIPVYPTPFYETIMGLILFAFLWSIRKKINAPGVLFGIYLIINGLERFLIEKIRVNNTVNFLGMNITQAEIISTGLVIAGIAIVVIQSRKKEPV